MNVHASGDFGASICNQNRHAPFDFQFPSNIQQRLPVLCWTLTSDGSVLGSNDAWTEFAGEEVFGSRATYWWEWIDPDQQFQAKETWLDSMDSNAPFEMHCRLRSKAGNYEWFLIRSASATLPPDLAPTPAGSVTVRQAVCCNVQNLYDEFDHFAEKARIESDMLNASVDCIKMINLDGSLQRMNRSGCIALGIDVKSKFGMKWVDLVPQSMKRRVRRAIAVAATGKRARFSGSTQLPGQPVQHWDNILTPLLDPAGRPISILCVSREITLQRAAEARLRAASERDPLTGLLNRKSFRSKANRWLNKARQSGDLLALLLIDLDHFKSVNDSYGHPEGDHLIREIAKRIEKEFQSSGLLSRLGGDEFAIILRDICPNREELLTQLRKSFAKISSNVLHGGRQINAGMSVGVSLFPNDATELTDWLRKSDIALSDTKANFKGTVRFFEDSMGQKNFCSIEQLNAIRSLLNSESFEVHYQKQFLLSDATATEGTAAELRLKSDVQELLDIIPKEILSSNHTIANESATLLRSMVIQDLTKRSKKNRTLSPVLVRIPAGELMRDQFAASFLDQLKKHKVAPKSIRIEVHESVFQSRSAELAIRALRELSSAGIEIILGDFGDGLTSLRQLASYPINGVRISEKLTGSYLEEPVCAAIVRSICQLCRDLNLTVSAQSIHSIEQRDALQLAGCNLGTGHCFEA